jgi:hypothetical protein
LALRLRDLYKWEKGLEPWVEKDSSEILEWIGDKEEEWDQLGEKDFSEIIISDKKYDPFDTRGINAVLESHGLFYGAGFVHSLKPTFILAILEEKKEIDGYTVYILGRELARDLLTLPALSQERSIIIRKESAKLFLWNNILFIKKSGRLALKFALETYGLQLTDYETLRRNLEIVSADEIERYIYHELGEIQDKVFHGDTWREIIATFPHTPIELLSRSVKDLLADTNHYGTLRHIIKERNRASLGFYVAFLDGLTKELFPELFSAFEKFTQTSNWNSIEQAVATGYDKAKYYAESLIDIYEEGKKRKDMMWAAEEIKTRLLAPMGIG